MIRLNNNIAFFDQNRETYERCLKQPLWDLARDLEPTLLQIDPAIETRPANAFRACGAARVIRKTSCRTAISFGSAGATVPAIRGSRTRLGFILTSALRKYLRRGAYAATAAQSKDLRERILANPAGFDRIAAQSVRPGSRFRGRLCATGGARASVPGRCAYYRKKSFHLERALPMTSAIPARSWWKFCAARLRRLRRCTILSTTSPPNLLRNPFFHTDCFQEVQP
jgi:hypothetical protein